MEFHGFSGGGAWFRPGFRVLVEPRRLVVLMSVGRQIWSWTKAEGGSMAELSCREIQEMIATGNLRENVAQLVARHQAR